MHPTVLVGPGRLPWPKSNNRCSVYCQWFLLMPLTPLHFAVLSCDELMSYSTCLVAYMRTHIGAGQIPQTPMAHCDIYREQLGFRYPLLGHAIWEPTSVDVGDVGFIRDGKFLRLFSSLHPKDHPSNLRFGVPDYHEPLIPRVSDHLDKGILKHGHYSSSGVQVADETETFWAG